MRHTTVEDLVAGEAARSAEDEGFRQVRAGVIHARGSDPVPVAVLKGDARMAAVLHRAVWAHVAEPQEALVLPRGVAAVAAAGVPGAKRSSRSCADAAPATARRARCSPTGSRTRSSCSWRRRATPPTTACRTPSPAAATYAATSTSCGRRWSRGRFCTGSSRTSSFLVSCTEGVLTDDEAESLLWSPPPRSRATARWSPADVVLLDELADLLRRTPSLGHVVLDEAQDLSPMQLRAVGRRCSTGAATVLGDIAQGTTPWATPSWDVALSHLGHPEAHLEVLDRGFRVPAAVISFAARLLPVIAPGMSAPTSVRDDPGSLSIVPVDGSGLWPGGARARSGRRWPPRGRSG